MLRFNDLGEINFAVDTDLTFSNLLENEIDFSYYPKFVFRAPLALVVLLFAPTEVNDTTFFKQNARKRVSILVFAKKLNIAESEQPLFTLPFWDAYNATFFKFVRNSCFTFR